MLTDPSFYAVALPAVVLYGLSKGGFSGVGLLAVPLMSTVMSPVQAAAILLPVLIAQDIVTIYSFRRTWDATTLRLILPGATVGIALGTMTAAMISTPLIRLAVGLLAVAFCLNAWFGPEIRRAAPRPHNRGSATVLGTIAGYTSFVIHAGGPPFNMYTLPRVRDSLTFVGTSAMFFGIANLVKLPPYFLLGQFTTDNLILSAALMPVAVVGNLAGIWLVRRLSKDFFYQMIYALTFLVGLKLIFDSYYTSVA